MKSLLLAVSISLVAGCSQERPVTVAAAAAPQVSTHIEAKQFLMDSDAFDLATLMGKLQEGLLKDASAIEEYINSTPGINNVDLDQSGQVDPLTVREQEGSADGRIVMAINAHPKGQPDPVTVAEIEFTKTASGEVAVSGAYPEYVGGYQDNYYSYRRPMGVGDALFYAWLFSPRPHYYHRWGGGHYGGYGYMSPRPVMGRSALRTTRTTTRTNSTVAPVKKAARPKTYAAKTAGAKKVVKKQAARKTKAAKASTVKGMKGQQKAFAKRDTSKAKPKATNLRKSKPKPKSSFGSSRPKKRSSFGSSRPSRSSSRRR